MRPFGRSTKHVFDCKSDRFASRGKIRVYLATEISRPNVSFNADGREALSVHGVLNIRRLRQDGNPGPER
jgi:hypothetical protein